MKILYVTTIGGTMRFFRQFIKELTDTGHTVDVACNTSISDVPDFYKESDFKIYKLNTERHPFNKGNLKAIKQIKKLIKENNYDVVHCHTPIAAMCTRLACIKARKKGLRVIYTAHGFHFYKDAPLKNWLMYYTMEKICSFFTDTLITINKEDYNLAKTRLNAEKTEYVPGVGINIKDFEAITVNKAEKRKSLGIPEDAVLLLSVGELNENKNHETAIRAIANIENVYYIIAGRGKLHNYHQNLIKSLNVSDRVKILGHRNDVIELDKISDIFVFPSYREGLSVSVMEAMANGLPVACSNIRGNTDLIDENGGITFDPHSTESCEKAIRTLIDADVKKMGEYNKEKIKSFEISNVNEMMRRIYNI